MVLVARGDDAERVARSIEVPVISVSEDMQVIAVYVAEGKWREARAELAIARDYGMRLVGPNCVGVLNTDPSVRLNATFATLPMLPGANTVARRAIRPLRSRW